MGKCTSRHLFPYGGLNSQILRILGNVNSDATFSYFYWKLNAVFRNFVEDSSDTHLNNFEIHKLDMQSFSNGSCSPSSVV